MIPNERKVEIEQLAKKINDFSERYQLIHATAALEKLYKEKEQSEYIIKFNDLRNKIKNANIDEKKELFKQAEELKRDSNKRIKILIDYSDKIISGNARMTHTKNNTFIIMLPKSMENIRKSDGSIDFKKRDALRDLMAHELGHIALHSGIIDSFDCSSETETEKEEEAKYFADVLVSLRNSYSNELSKRTS